MKKLLLICAVLALSGCAAVFEQTAYPNDLHVVSNSPFATTRGNTVTGKTLVGPKDQVIAALPADVRAAQEQLNSAETTATIRRAQAAPNPQ